MVARLVLLLAGAAVAAAEAGAATAAAAHCEPGVEGACVDGQADSGDSSLLQLQQAGHSAAAAAAGGGEDDRGAVCSVFEVCQCQSGPRESSTVCKPGTCRFDRNFSKIQYCYWHKPHCKNWKHWPSWQNCHWANFHDPSGKYPGDGNLLTAIPGKDFPLPSDSNLTSITVFTDMDDTLVCSGGGVAGVDTKCQGTAEHELYPGVAEFMLAITEGPSGELPLKKVIPLSARPRELQKVLRIKKSSPENQAFKAVGGSDWGFDVDHACYGKLKDGLDVVERGVGEAGMTPYRRMGFTKYRSWKQALHKDWWEGSSVFVGDNGQGDLVAAQMMLKTRKLLAAFIHDVRGRCHEQYCKKRWSKYGVFLFENYVEAAAVALANGLISQSGCQRVCDAKGAEAFTCGC